jgi:Zn-dependent peptidase ImmA (M78 family)/transcriptional regulator with XRE-family HTH domain
VGEIGSAIMATLNPEILRWARTTAGLSLEEAAHAIELKEAFGSSGPERLATLEAGKEEPSRSLLLRMARAYRRSLLVFYLEKPPRTGDRGKDFRTLPGGTPPLYNPLLDALIRDIRGRQSIIRSLLEDSETERLPFIGSATMDIPVPALAERIIKQLRFDLNEFRRQTSFEAAFTYLRLRTEDSGIYVLLLGNLGSYHTNIPVDTFRGFALADEIAPLAVINDNDAVSAWSFTALHEVAHLWLGDTGVSGWATGLAIEQYCSDVAAEILLPPRELDEFARIGKTTFDQLVELVSRFADRRNISRAMVAYRVFRTGAISRKTWGDLNDRFHKDWLAHREREALKQKDREGGPSYYVVKRHRIGRALLGLVNRSLGEGLLTYTKAGRLLGVRARNVEPLLSGGAPSRGGE